MVVIINGYVALSKLDSGFAYIVLVNIGACFAWGTIDGLIYAISSSIERNNVRNKLLALKKAVNSSNVLGTVKANFNDTFLAGFDEKGKDAIANDIIAHVPDASLGENRVLTKKELLGWLSIICIYLGVGFLLALPFLVLHDKILAWFISNSVGVAWLFWYGVQLGKVAGKNRWLIGVLLSVFSILFLASSYLLNTR